MDHKERIIRIAISLTLSFLCISFVTPRIFLNDSPTINSEFLSSIPLSIASLTNQVAQSQGVRSSNPSSFFSNIELQPIQPTHSASPTANPPLMSTVPPKETIPSSFLPPTSAHIAPTIHPPTPLPTSSQHSLRIMTYNINNEPKCLQDSSIQKARIEALAQNIIDNKVDIASLQEVRNRKYDKDGKIIKSTSVDEAVYLAEVLKARKYPMEMIDSYEDPHYGGFRAIALSRFPAEPSTLVRFRMADSGRNGLYVKLNTPLGVVWFVSLHTRFQQAAADLKGLKIYFNSQFKDFEKRVIAAGDFNGNNDAMVSLMEDYPKLVNGVVDFILAHKTSDFRMIGQHGATGSSQPTRNFCPGDVRDNDGHHALYVDIGL